jgi:hypothetical protein
MTIIDTHRFNINNISLLSHAQIKHYFELFNEKYLILALELSKINKERLVVIDIMTQIQKLFQIKYISFESSDDIYYEI